MSLLFGKDGVFLFIKGNTSVQRSVQRIAQNVKTCVILVGCYYGCLFVSGLAHVFIW